MSGGTDTAGLARSEACRNIPFGPLWAEKLSCRCPVPLSPADAEHVAPWSRLRLMQRPSTPRTSTVVARSNEGLMHVSPDSRFTAAAQRDWQAQKPPPAVEDRAPAWPRACLEAASSAKERPTPAGGYRPNVVKRATCGFLAVDSRPCARGHGASRPHRAHTGAAFGGVYGRYRNGAMRVWVGCELLAVARGDPL
jgi:hypothetical protein